jgi:hypothetical protein
VQEHRFFLVQPDERGGDDVARARTPAMFSATWMVVLAS